MNHGSLFSGIGGFDLAAEWMGWENKFHCDINPFSRKICSYYWPEAVSYENIKTTDFRSWRGKIDVLSGGFPCQPFSHAGKRMGKEDERHLWPDMVRAIREIRPRYVVGENVRGIVSWSEGLVFEEVCADLESEGYECWAFILPAVSINAPHKRDRVYFIAKDTRSDGRIQREVEQEGAEVREQRNSSTGSSERVHLQEGNHTDTKCEGLEGFDWKRQGRTIDRSDEGLLFGAEDKLNATNSDSGGLEGSTPFGRNSEYVERTSKFGNAADSERIRLEHGSDARDILGSVSEAQGEERKSPDDFETDDYVYPQQGGPSEAWDYFPIKSPLCSGDDGLPSELDGLTFPKWRKESIMGYGNAIVPQLAYRIFETIYELEN